MTQPSEWVTKLLATKNEAERIDEINAELKVRDERILQSKAPESILAILEKLKVDCKFLVCQISDIPPVETMGQPGVRLQCTGRATIRIVTALSDIKGHRIKVVRFHIRNGVDGSDSKEFIEMKLMDNDEIVFLVGDEEHD